jgi:signal transduction histidine kinase
VTAYGGRTNEGGDHKRPLPSLKLRSTVLIKAIAALAIALMVSSILTSVVAAELTRSVLTSRGHQLGRGQLNILQEAYAERERTLILNLRNLAQIFNARGLFAVDQRPELIAELGRASSNLDLDLLRVLDDRGMELSPAAGVGSEVGDAELLGAVSDSSSTSKLLQGKTGTFTQTVAIPTVSGERHLLLIGGYAYNDQFAFRLRKQIGSLDDVVLVAGREVVGSTLADTPRQPPGAGGESFPNAPAIVRFGGAQRMVAYVPVGGMTDLRAGAIGLILANPVASLDAPLARARLVATVVLAVVALGVGWLLFRLLVRPLVRLATTAQRIAAGDLDASFEASSADEIGMLADSLERMRLELRTKLDLIAQQAAELQTSSHRVVAAEDRERHRLARDLHDGLQQQLVVLRMQVAMAEESHTEDSLVMEKFDRLGQEVDAIIDHLREVTQNLYPSILLDRGLAPATQSHLARLAVSAQLACEPNPFPRLAPEIENAAYFLLCEALTNVLKHASASRIRVSLAIEGEGPLVVAVEDDGSGFIPDQTRRTGGCVHMNDRVKSFGGEFQITARPGAGTRVVASFPQWQSGSVMRTGGPPA